jgi:type VI secretion system secreted protein VgrG
MSAIDNGALPKTVAWHDPGQYAWQNSAHGERLLSNQRQATDARMKQFDGQGTVRTAAPGTPSPWPTTQNTTLMDRINASS